MYLCVSRNNNVYLCIILENGLYRPVFWLCDLSGKGDIRMIDSFKDDVKANHFKLIEKINGLSYTKTEQE